MQDQSNASAESRADKIDKSLITAWNPTNEATSKQSERSAYRIVLASSKRSRLKYLQSYLEANCPQWSRCHSELQTDKVENRHYLEICSGDLKIIRRLHKLLGDKTDLFTWVADDIMWVLYTLRESCNYFILTMFNSIFSSTRTIHCWCVVAVMGHFSIQEIQFSRRTYFRDE